MAWRRTLFTAALFIFAWGCGKSAQKQIQQAVAGFDGAELKSNQIEISNIQGDGEYTIAEVTVRTAVKLRKENGQWVIDEVRLGDRRWEKAERIVAALDFQRRQDALGQLEQIRQGIRGYRAQHSEIPQSDGFTALIDELTPRYLAQVVRIDPWSNPFQYRALGPDSYDLRSAGPDGKFETEDDVLLENP